MEGPVVHEGNGAYEGGRRALEEPVVLIRDPGCLLGIGGPENL